MTDILLESLIFALAYLILALMIHYHEAMKRFLPQGKKWLYWVIVIGGYFGWYYALSHWLTDFFTMETVARSDLKLFAVLSLVMLFSLLFILLNFMRLTATMHKEAKRKEPAVLKFTQGGNTVEVAVQTNQTVSEALQPMIVFLGLDPDRIRLNSLERNKLSLVCTADMQLQAGDLLLAEVV